MFFQFRFLRRWYHLSSISCFILCFAISILFVTLGLLSKTNPEDSNLLQSQLFDGFDNETGVDHFIVPNIIHLIRFDQSEFTFLDYICLQAAYHHHRPDFFYIHTNVKKGFEGKYWSRIIKDLELKSRIKILYLEPPSEIFGQTVNPEWRLWHGGDIARIRVMMKYGGIFLDNDVFVIQNLDKYRKFEMALNWDEGQFLGTQVLIAHKDARFLSLWLNSYREYYPERWYYNAGEKPTKEVLEKHPELVHRVKVKFGADTDISWSLYNVMDYDWRSLDAIHLLTNHRYYRDPSYNTTPVYHENNIKTNKYSFGEMIRDLIDLCCNDWI